MSDTNKDKRQAKVKRGDAKYQRNNPRKTKQSNEPKLPREVSDLVGFTAEEGFFAKLKRAIFM